MSFGSYTLNPNTITNLSFSVVWLPSQAYPCPDITGLVDAANEVKDFYKDQKEAIATTTFEAISNRLLWAYPNPAYDKTTLHSTSSNVTIQSCAIVQYQWTTGTAVKGITSK